MDEEVTRKVLELYNYGLQHLQLILAHPAALSEHFVREGVLRPGDLVVEAASNDGTVLRAFPRRVSRANRMAFSRPATSSTTVVVRLRAEHGPAKLGRHRDGV
jgi:hypothetical protein